MLRRLLAWISAAGVLGGVASLADATPVEPAARVALEARILAVRAAWQASIDDSREGASRLQWSNWNNWNNWGNWGNWGNWFNR